MKYIVIIAKHHDGFHMWDTEYSEHKITNTPFGRDYIKELVDASHRSGLRVGLYFSQRDWYHPDYEPLKRDIFEEKEGSPPYRNSTGEKIGITPRHRNFIRYMHGAVRELMSKFGRIDILWWDASWWGGMFYEEMWDTLIIEEEARRLQPGLLINNRGSVPGDFDTPECQIGYFHNARAWESCMPLGNAWAWTGTGVKPLRRIVQDLVRCACGDGNYLLSVGCMPNGRFDEPEMQRLREVGDWMRLYGESIYSTRGGPFLPDTEMGSTYRESTVYLHVLNASSGTIKVPIIPENEIIGSQVLTGGTVEYETTRSEYIFQVSQLEPINTIIKIEFAKPVQAQVLRKFR